jgi:hypothetical protein
LGGQFLRLPLIIFFLKLLPFFEGNDVFPIHIVFDIADRCELGKKTFTTKGCTAIPALSQGLVIFGSIKDIIKIHLVKFFVLL